MIASRLSLFFLLVLCVAIASAGDVPAPGNYSGVLTVEKLVLGTKVKTQVRALARVSATGTLSVALLAPPNAFPDKAGTDFQAAISSAGTVIIPRTDADMHRIDLWFEGVHVLLPAPAGLPSAVTVATRLPYPEYEGVIEAKGGTRFSLSYDDVPERYRDSEGNLVSLTTFVAILPTKHFTFIFRRVGD